MEFEGRRLALLRSLIVGIIGILVLILVLIVVLVVALEPGHDAALALAILRVCGGGFIRLVCFRRRRARLDRSEGGLQPVKGDSSAGDFVADDRVEQRDGVRASHRVGATHAHGHLLVPDDHRAIRYFAHHGQDGPFLSDDSRHRVLIRDGHDDCLVVVDVTLVHGTGVRHLFVRHFVWAFSADVVHRGRREAEPSRPGFHLLELRLHPLRRIVRSVSRRRGTLLSLGRRGGGVRVE